MKIFVNRSQESLEKKFMGTHCNALLANTRSKKFNSASRDENEKEI